MSDVRRQAAMLVADVSDSLSRDASGDHLEGTSAALAQALATVYVGDQLARIAAVIEESAKVGGIAHAVPTTILEVVRALDRQTKAIEDGGMS